MTKKLSPFWTVVIGLALSAAACVLTLRLQIGSFETTMEYLLNNPTLLVLNWLPMGLMTALLTCLTGNVFFGGGLTALIWGMLSYINLVKIMARGDPFVPGDVMLLFEGIEAAGSYELDFPLKKLAMMLGASVGMILPGFWLKCRMGKMRLRLLGAALSLLVLAGAVAGPYADKTFYEELPGPDRANVPLVFDTFGFPYCFLHNFNLYPVDKPENYSQQEAAGFDAEYRQEQVLPEQMPNILMIMCETFTDLPNHPAFTYSEEENPLAYYNSLTAREDVISGQMIVSNIGAGTANTEFDVLTGMMTNRIGDGTTSAFRVVHRNLDTMPRMLSEVGYRTFFTHPGDSWFYNRESVYSYFGITDHMFNESYDEEDFKGTWISDRAFLEKLTAALEERDGDAPLFTYGVSIQNHQSYTIKKYGYLPDPVPTELSLSDDAQQYLSVYFEGLRDSDEMLKNLTAWLEAQEEPWLLAFFGDHQANLGADFLSLREIGGYPENLDTAENRLSLYSVPYLIWGNQAFHETADMPTLQETTISSHYLGALTCEVAGFRGLDGYFDYLNDLRRDLPVCSVSGYMTADGQYHEELSGELYEMEELRHRWQYYRLKHEDLTKE